MDLCQVCSNYTPGAKNEAALGVTCFMLLDRVAQSVMCLETDASLTAEPGVASLIPTGSNSFVEIDHEMISMVILFPYGKSFKKGCCRLQAKVCA